MQGVLGPLDDPIVFDEFTYDEVKGAECFGRVCRNICRGMKEKEREKERLNRKMNFLCVCIPCYNESFDDLSKTLASVMANIDFLKHKTRFNDDQTGTELLSYFQSLEIVIVPIFDGVKAMDETMKNWLKADFPGSMKDMDQPTAPSSVHVRVCSARWWYYCWDTLRVENETTGLTMNDSYLHFQLVPIIKKTNHRKHNSHHWFFQGICAGLNAALVFLTDCGTSYEDTCVGRLVYALRTRRDLIGVTARQRVETPNPNFHPCEKTLIPFLQGSHPGLGSPPCWKCYLSYLLSPAVLQGFEFEGSLIMNSALFNLVEAMPVLPGPCQLLDWQRMRKYRVVEEYFDLLFNEDTDLSSAAVLRSRPLPAGYFNTKKDIENDKELTTNPVLGAFSSPPVSQFRELSDDTNENGEQLRLSSSVAAVPPPFLTGQSDLESSHGSKSGELSFTEFLRVNMRLAEDRVLSFVTVFCTGFGTKWIPGATFYYEPEVTFQTLLTQRRRWINGTVAAFMYVFSSNRAASRVKGGFFDSHKAGKSLRFVTGLWALNLLQFVFVLVSPTVFGVAMYNGLVASAKYTSTFDWVRFTLFEDVRISISFVCLYLLVYVAWTLNSFYVKGGKVAEWICGLVVLFSALAIAPVYIGILISALENFTIVHFLVIASILGPVVIALTQSATSAFLYLLYLPYFIALVVFFLVFIPSYSFSRLWDTSWGNRQTGPDESISVAREDTMKTNVFLFNLGLVYFNVVSTLALCISLTNSGQLIFMGILLFPTMVQILGSVCYLVLIAPFRSFVNRE